MQNTNTQTTTEEKRDLFEGISPDQSRCHHLMLLDQCALCAGLPRAAYTSGSRGGASFQIHSTPHPIIKAKPRRKA